MTERALLVSVTTSGPIDASLDELARLANTAGATVIDRVVQRRERLDPATLIGSGRLAKLREMVDAEDIDVLIFDGEITPAQERNLSAALDVRVLDRTALILDIFALHANSSEGRLQVELAQLQYLLPRLRGRGIELSRLGGGIGTRGPGETQLETDRRRIARRVSKLRRDLEGLERTRLVKRDQRRQQGIPIVSLVGYTNAGKSSLLNALTGSSVLVEDQLFATLDPATRRCTLPGGRELLITDTVGFIQRLPHQLVEAFTSTLELVAESDLLLHLVDVTGEEVDAQIDAVRAVLEEIGAAQIPEVLIGTKADVATPQHRKRFLSGHDGSLVVSSVSGEGIDELTDRVWELVSQQFSELEVIVPFGAEVERLHRVADVLEEEYRSDGVHLKVRLSRGEADRVRRYAV
ncbi:MAG: GTPase HflX [Gammaproteobacteria bacterium]|nr:GTPase HflX [Gammaproteobacteria bacterium]